jgi:hypothetical protein
MVLEVSVDLGENLFEEIEPAMDVPNDIGPVPRGALRPALASRS